MKKRNFKKRKKTNPQGVRIYGRVLSIEAQKIGPHKGCDAECRHCDHKYIHEFRTTHAQMIGLSPGDVITIPAGKWPLLIIE